MSCAQLLAGSKGLPEEDGRWTRQASAKESEAAGRAALREERK